MRDARSLPVPRRRGWHRKRRVWHRCRTACDLHAGHAAGHAAPAISPRRFVGRHRAACFARLSAGLRTHGCGIGEPLPPWSRLPGITIPVPVATSSPSTAAGQCRDERHIRGYAPHRLPFSSSGSSHRNRQPQHIGQSGMRQSKHGSPFNAQTKSGPKPAFLVPPMALAITRRCLRLRRRPSSTGGCGPACRLPAP